MDEKLRHLLALAQNVEVECYFPQGREVDGAVYTMRTVSFPLVDQAIPLMGGLRTVEKLVLGRQKNEPLADPNCGNWILWTVLNEMEVSRERT